MAFNKDNYFEEGNNEADFFVRTNPLANSANAEILKIEECGSCEIELGVTIATIAGDTTVTIDAPTSGYTDLSAFTVQLTDGKGNFATGVGSTTIDTSALDSGVNWIVTIYVARGTDNIVNCVCSKKFNFGYSPADGIVIDTTEIGIGDLRGSLTENGIYDAGGFDAGSFPAGGVTENVTFFAKNISGNVLQIGSVTIGGGTVISATWVSLLQGKETMFAGDAREFLAVIDSSGVAGAYLGTVIFTMTDGTTQQIQIVYTLV